MEESNDRWSWTESSVWTKRMLNALENGVKGNKWYSLIDKVYEEDNLLSAFQKVNSKGGAAGVDRMTLKMFGTHCDYHVKQLEKELKNQTYEPKPVRRKTINKPGGGKRPLGIPTVRDRVVQKALCHVIEPIFEFGFSPDSYGFRPGKGCKDALRAVEAAIHAGRLYVVDADIKGFFDSINHDILMEQVACKISDGRVLELIQGFLKQEVLDSMNRWCPEEGTPQGAVISPLLANIYLDGLDWTLRKALFLIIRYADDFIILCETEELAQEALRLIKDWCAQRKLVLHPDKTRLVDLNIKGAYVDFLGYRFQRTKGTNKIVRLLRPKSESSLREKIRCLTRRKNGRSLDDIIKSINCCLRGWFEYFKHAHYTIFDPLDGWIRMRLRSILRKRNKKKGRGDGYDHFTYPNEYFRKMGLFSLKDAHIEKIQSR